MTSSANGGEQHHDNKDNGPEDVNPYLALREAKIKRNQDRLRALGLLSSKPPPARNTRGKTEAKRNSQKSPQASPRTEQNNPPRVGLRRSGRISRPPEDPASSWESPASESGRKLGRKRPRSATIAPPELSGTVPSIQKPIRRSAPGAKAPPAPNSVRGISLDTTLLVLGSLEESTRKAIQTSQEETDDVGVLGRLMERTGKEFVVYEAFERAASPDDRFRLQNAKLSFNKYSGVQEWQNCVFLWVNLGSPSSSGGIVNEFLEGGRRITWFGGSRMIDEETPIVQKLLEWGRAAADSGSSKLVLWCRSYEPARKAFGPYICLGRLAYESHDPDSYPLAFVWNLLDSERLLQHENAKIREEFNGLLRLASSS